MDINEDAGLLNNHIKWSWWDLFLVLLALMSLMAFAALFRNQIRHFFSASGLKGVELQMALLFFSTLLQSSILVGAAVFIARRRGAAIRELGLVTDNIGRNIIMGFFGGLILGIAIWGVGTIMFRFFGPPPPQDVERVLTGLKWGRNMILPFLAVGILAPISEEIYFRGMVFPVVKERFGSIVGIVGSGIFFGSLHLDLYRFLPLAAGGIVLAYFYEKTKSLVPSIVAHSMWNTLMLLSLLKVS